MTYFLTHSFFYAKLILKITVATFPEILLRTSHESYEFQNFNFQIEYAVHQKMSYLLYRKYLSLFVHLGNLGCVLI